MAIDKVKEYFKQWNKEKDILEFTDSSATVDLAASALGVIPARIAKTLSFQSKVAQEEGGCLLIVTAGDAKIDNSKFKGFFNMKAKMLSPDEVLSLTGHAVGGVCPFAIENSAIKIYADISMKRFDTVFPACGSSNSAIELSCEDLFQFAKAIDWIDVCKGWEAG